MTTSPTTPTQFSKIAMPVSDDRFPRLSSKRTAIEERHFVTTPQRSANQMPS